MLHSNADVKYLTDLCSSLSLHLIHFSTIHHTAATDTLIDVCLVDKPNNTISSGQSPEPFISHHELIFIDYPLPGFKTNSTVQQSFTYRNWSSVTPDSMINEFNKYDWNLFIHYHDIHHLVSAFTWRIKVTINFLLSGKYSRLNKKYTYQELLIIFAG